MNKDVKFILGLYSDPDQMMSGIDQLLAKGIKVYDVFTPMPIHGIEDKLKIKRSRLPKAAFWFGFTGTSLAILMMTYMLVWDWPMNFGGKPAFAFPDFIPITFEVTVLLSAFGMTFTYYFVNHLFPGRAPRVMDLSATDDRFVIAVDATNVKHEEVDAAFKNSGAVEIKHNERKYIDYDKD